MKRLFFTLFSVLVLIMIFSGCNGGGVVVNLDVPPSAPGLTSPVDSEQGLLPVLRWGAALLAEAYDIKLWKSTEAEEFTAQNVTGTSYTVQSSLDNSSLYYWKIVAKNAFGQTESERGAFSTAPLKNGNYIEIKDIQANADSSFTLVLAGSVTDARALEIKLMFDSSQIELVPSGDSSDIELVNLSSALAIITPGTNTLTVSISNPTNFSLNNQEFLRITCDAKSVSGVFQVTLDNSSNALDDTFSAINLDKSDIGYVFIK